MNSLAYRISVIIKRTNPEETCSIDIMQYALNIILNTLLIITGSAIVGLLLNHFAETITFFISFSLIRVCSGGFHLKSAAACNLVTMLLCTLIPYFVTLSGQSLQIINIFSLMVMILFAPNPDKNAQIPIRWYPGLKLVSIFMVGVNFLIGSSVLGLAFLVQSLTVIPWKRRNII